MKNVLKLIGFIAMLAIIGFTFAACGDADSGGGTATDGKAVYTSEDADGNSYVLIITGKASGSTYKPQNGDGYTLVISYKNGPTKTSTGILANVVAGDGDTSTLTLKVSEITFTIYTHTITNEVSVMTEIDGNVPITSSTDNNTDTIIIFRKPLTPVVENVGSTVIGVILNKTEIVLGVGRTETLAHTVIPTNAANRNVSWSTTNTAIATVSQSGLVTGVSAGSATIRVTTEDGSKSAICNVTVTAVQTPVVNDYNITPLYGDDDIPYAISITPKPGKSPGAVTVWYQGINVNYPKTQTFPSEIGEYMVSFDVAAAEGWNAASGITVGKIIIEGGDQTIAVASVTLNRNTLSLAVGGTETLTATVSPSNATNKSVTWNSSNTAVATVSATGLVRGVSAGSATIRVTSVADSSKYATCTVTVTTGSTGNMIWTRVANSTFNTNPIYAIAYGNGKFVAGGWHGQMATSTNGTTWTTVADSKFRTGIDEIAYGNGKFVAGGDVGRIAYSSDGTTWTSVTDSIFGSERSIYGLAYGNGKFVVGGVDGRTSTSTDGVIWTAVTDSKLTFISTIAYGNGKFVAGGPNGKMSTSSDGVTWTTVADSKFGSSEICSIAYGNNKFIAGGVDGKMSTSSDGVTWTTVANTTFGTNGGIFAIAYDNGKFVAGGVRDSRGHIAYSSDGTTWTAVADSTFNEIGDGISAMAYGNGKFVAVGGYQIAYSDDGSGSVVQNLSGNITISPTVNVTTGTVLTATYSGNESVSYQWKNGTSNVGTNSNKHTPTTAGSYTVTVSASGYNSKTSAAVQVSAASAGGTFTMTGIPSQYNGKWVIIETDYFMDDHGFTIGGAQSINFATETITGALISNGSVSVPMWQISPSNVVTGYTGNHTISLAAGIMNTATDPSSPNILAVRIFYTVVFSNGSATRAWSAGVDGNNVPVTGVTLNKTTLSLTVGGSETLTATVAPSDATNKNLSWKSSATGIATVTQNGLVTAVAAGSATITVTTEDGNKTATCNVTVTAGDDEQPFTSIAAFKAWLDKKSNNTSATAYEARVNISDLAGSASTSGSLGSALRANINKYVKLDLSGSTFTSIVGWAFDKCKNLTVINISNSVTSIGQCAFLDSSLTSVIIPNSVTIIGFSTFGGCTSLTSVTIPNSVTSIGFSTFIGCTSLTSVTIPNSVTSIEYASFKDCTSLTSVTIPNSVTSIGFSTFEGCKSLTSITLPNSVTSIGYGAFAGTGLTSVIIPNDVTILEDETFGSCFSLTSVNIPNSVTSIGEGTFRATGLPSITIPNSVNSIGRMAFRDCFSLTSVTFQGTISSTGFSNETGYPAFSGDLRDKFYATDPVNGTPGMYIRANTNWETPWTLQ